MGTERATPWERSEFPHFLEIQTRWMDNDLYGHVNNATYYSYFDTVVNRYLIEARLLELQAGQTIGLVVETGCSYFQEIAFPERIFAGLRVAKIGKSSVRFEVALFRENESAAAAQGYFVHVYVDRAARRPVEMSDGTKRELTKLAKQG